MNNKIQPLALKTFTQTLNIGDVFSQFAAKQYFKKTIKCYDRLPLTFPNLVFIGSIFDFADENSVVCGSGLMYRLPVKRKPYKITLTRGPLTFSELQRQGIQAPHLFADPGVLLPCTIPYSQRVIDHKIGIVPHYIDLEHPWVKKASQDGHLVISPKTDPISFSKQIQRCETILSSSLHGIIFAHSCGIRACWTELSNKVIGDGFKFYDYYASLAVAPDNVKRVKITEITEPSLIASYATHYSQNRLVQNALLGILNAKEALDNIEKQSWQTQGNPEYYKSRSNSSST